MKRTVLTGVMILTLAATSAFAEVSGSNQGTKPAKPAAALTAPAGTTMTASSHKRRTHHRRHKAAKKVTTSTKTK